MEVRNGKEWEDALRAQKLINFIMEQTEDYSDENFDSLMCMLCEEHCKRKNKDVVRYAMKQALGIKIINTIYGKY